MTSLSMYYISIVQAGIIPLRGLDREINLRVMSSAAKKLLLVL